MMDEDKHPKVLQVFTSVTSHNRCLLLGKVGTSPLIIPNMEKVMLPE